MLITSYNQPVLGDTLIAILAPDAPQQSIETKGNITRIFDTASNETLGFNFLEVSQTLSDLKGRGQVFLSEAQVAQLNEALVAAGFAAELVADLSPKIVIGHVDTLTDHPDSDHLKVTETAVGDGETVQIVSGSPNMQADILVVVAKVGAMMPDGLIIWPGELRGVKSNGMICSGRELHVLNAPNKPGALILPPDFQPVGQAFDQAKADTLFV